MMLGDKVPANVALLMGMLYKVCTDEKLHNDAMAAATILDDMPTKGIGMTKRLLNQSLQNNLEQQLEAESKMQVAATGTYDYLEGVKAFLEKRKPEFKGE